LTPSTRWAIASCIRAGVCDFTNGQILLPTNNMGDPPRSYNLTNPLNSFRVISDSVNAVRLLSNHAEPVISLCDLTEPAKSFRAVSDFLNCGMHLPQKTGCWRHFL